MKLKEAQRIAAHLIVLFTPLCDRIAVAGSVRREKPEVHDIEIVCVPKKYTFEVETMFGTETVTAYSKRFIETVNKFEKLKGDADGKNTQRLLPEGITLDLFMVYPESWGYQLAIRTGSSDYSHYLAKLWNLHGYFGEEGHLRRKSDKQIVPVREEIDLFKLIHLEFVPPQHRGN